MSKNRRQLVREDNEEVQRRSSVGMKNPSAWKETEIGLLPEEWEVASVGDLAEVHYGKARPKTEGGTPVVGSGGVYAWANEALVGHPTIVIGRKGSAGQTWLMDKPCWPSDTTFYLKLTGEVDLYFLFSYLRFNPLSGEHAKTTLPSLSRPYLENYPVPCPPLPEQRRIAAALRTIQQAIAAQEDVITAARELKCSLMERVFTYGPSPEPAPTRETEFGVVPEHWRVMELGEVIEEGPQNGIYKPKDLYGSGTMILRIDDYQNEGSVVSRAENSVKLSDGEVKKYGLDPGDLLVNRVNSLSHIGKTALVGDLTAPMVFESNMMRFGVNRNMVMPKYAFYFLTSNMSREQMRSKAKRAVAQASINQGDVKSMTFPLPSLAEQERIVRALDISHERVNVAQRHKAALEELFRSALEQLMTGQIRTQ
jgi:type I restriction enzyme S subunit